MSTMEPTPAPFHTQVEVRFRDCDPAGIVFYPRYLEMFNNLVEDWFRDGLQLPFSVLVGERRWGIPTVHLNVDFGLPSRMGETLDAWLAVSRLGRSSIHVEIRLLGPDGSKRVRGRAVLVLTDLNTHQAFELPEDLRSRLHHYMTSAAESAEQPNDERMVR